MSSELTEDQIKTILQGIAIPPQPQILVDLQMEQLSPNCNVDQIAKLISQDVGLSGSILKTVNSSFFQLASNITSITQAVNILGIKTVVNLVNAHSIKGELADDEIIALGRFWDNALDVAATALVIAKQIGIPDPDEAYTLGLFHNCGIPLMRQRHANYGEVIEESYHSADKLLISDRENQLLSTNHAVVGYYVSKAWNLPRYLCEVIHDHHNPERVLKDPFADSRKKNLIAVLKMSEHLCECFKTAGHQAIDHEWNRFGNMILEYVGMGEYDFELMRDSLIEIGLGGHNLFK